MSAIETFPKTITATLEIIFTYTPGITLIVHTGPAPPPQRHTTPVKPVQPSSPRLYRSLRPHERTTDTLGI